MARLRYNGLTATLDATGLTAAATSIGFAAPLTSMAGAVPTITGSDYIPLIIDSEIVHLTAYTSGATTGTISRAQGGTTAASHAGGSDVIHGPTVADFTPSPLVGKANRAAVQTVPHNTLTFISFDTETEDSGGMIDIAGNPTKVFAPVAGLYLVTANVRWAVNNTGKRTTFLVTSTGINYSMTLPASDDTPMSLTKTQRLAAGGYAQLAVTQTSGANLNTWAAEVELTMVYLGS